MNLKTRSRLTVAAASLCSLAFFAPSLHAEPAAKPSNSRPPVVRNLGPQRTITFKTVRTEKEGIQAEHWWTSKNLPGYRWKQQKLTQDTQRRIYDQVTLINKKGEETTVFFDITKWFGHN